MNRLTIAAAVAVAACGISIPAVAALASNGSTNTRGPSHSQVDDRSGPNRGSDDVTHSPSAVPTSGASTHVEPGDDRGTGVEPGDDNGTGVEPGDDNGTDAPGSASSSVEPGDDKGNHVEPGDDRGTGVEVGDDSGGHGGSNDDNSGHHGSDG
jgi:hypothetical protein